jgi:hypothetical protein
MVESRPLGAAFPHLRRRRDTPTDSRWTRLSEREHFRRPRLEPGGIAIAPGKAHHTAPGRKGGGLLVEVALDGWAVGALGTGRVNPGTDPGEKG